MYGFLYCVCQEVNTTAHHSEIPASGMANRNSLTAAKEEVSLSILTHPEVVTPVNWP